MSDGLLLSIWFALIGLIVGSYLNVLIHRIPRGKSTVLPRSRCPWCDGPIRAIDNLPVVSFLLLGGRCRHCGAPISWRYPLVEFCTAILFVACFAKLGLSPCLLTAMVFVGLMILLAGIDTEHFLLPDRITLPGIFVGLGLQLWCGRPGIVEGIIGTAVGAGILILVINYWYWIRGEEGMGIGDVNMLALIGAFLGWKGVLTTLFLATLSGSVAGLALLVLGKLGMRSRLPFGLFLALGGVLSLLFGDWLTASYLGML